MFKYPKKSQIRLSSNPRNFDNFLSIKRTLRRCTSAIYILSLCEVLEPYDRGFIPKCHGQTIALKMLPDGRTDGMGDSKTLGWGLQTYKKIHASFFFTLNGIHVFTIFGLE